MAEDLDSAPCVPHRGIGVRHGVVTPVDFDVEIEADPALFPFRVKVWLDRQRLEPGTISSTSAAARRRVPRPGNARSQVVGDDLRRHPVESSWMRRATRRTTRGHAIDCQQVRCGRRSCAVA